MSDWDEDADDDGTRDGRRQDARKKIHWNLVPALASSTDDLAAIYARGCHAKPAGVVVKTCTFTYGPAAGRKTVLTGDSHAAHWFPAINLVARHRGWRLITMTKSACPVADVTPISSGGIVLRDCARWHKALRAKIHHVQPDMVIASTYDGYAFVGALNKRTAESKRLWRQGLTRSLRSFRADAPRVVMLGDVFHWGKAAFRCMRTPGRSVELREQAGLDQGSSARDGTGRRSGRRSTHMRPSGRRGRSCAPTTRVRSWSTATW